MGIKPTLNLLNIAVSDNMSYSKELQVLYIDSYDSFAYNLTALLNDALSYSTKLSDITYKITHIQNNCVDSILQKSELAEKILTLYDLILIGPGPGSPTSENDTGIIYTLLKTVKGDFLRYKEVPIFGVCLGFQAICHHLDMPNSNKIKYLEKPVHGQVAALKLKRPHHLLYENVILENTDLLGTRYHSIYYDISLEQQNTVYVEDRSDFSNNYEEMFKVNPIATTSDDILMAASISGTRIMGVQYHLESCCSNHGLGVLCNYIQKCVIPYYHSNQREEVSSKEYLVGEEEKFEVLSDTFGQAVKETNVEFDIQAKLQANFNTFSYAVDERDGIDLHLNLIALFKELYGGCLMLGSLVKQKHRGEFSIFGIPNDDSVYYYYALNECKVYRDTWDTKTKAVVVEDTCDRSDYFKFIEKEFQTWQSSICVSAKDKKLFDSLPFTGGFIGILNYEMGSCVPQLDEYTCKVGSVFAKVNQALVWDHFEDKFHFIDISANGEKPHWDPKILTRVLTEIQKDAQNKSLSKEALLTEFPVSKVEKPDFRTYEEQFNKCQYHLHRGDSYELCLTTQCTVTLSEEIDSLKLFCKLSNMNPAPFSSFLCFPKLELTLLSSSPERFIKWDGNLKEVELRPIKGTVSKKKDPLMNIEKATAILKTPKEFGENLMIVDLIRNDLYKLLKKVELKELMSVEEYETVYQLVSVIKGSVPKEQYPTLTGLDILKSSLPPGSMTGAPKIKSVELLQHEIENLNINERGLYSGVTGFYSLNKRGDWSVNIRCLFSTDNISWNLGAGGAITVLSELEGEYDEMKIKLDSALQIFDQKR